MVGFDLIPIKQGRMSRSAFLTMQARLFRRHGLILVFISLAVLVLQVYWAEPSLSIPNIEATWHVIHTINALKSDSALHHYLLPSVTLGNALDRWVGWGAAVPTSSGSLIYTSFYSPGFIFAAISSSLFSFLDPFHGLVLMNVLLGAASAFLAYLLAWTVLGSLDLTPGKRALSAFFGGGANSSIKQRNSCFSWHDILAS